jgi:hypothetical protein
MVDDVMHVVAINVLVTDPSVREHLATGFDILLDFSVQAFCSYVTKDLIEDTADTNFSVSLKQAHDGNLARAASPFDCGLAAILVHEPREATNKTFVGLDFALHLLETTGLHRQSNAMVYEPCGFLRDFQISRNFIAAYAILAVSNQPHGSKPLVEAKGRIFKDAADLGAELAMVVLLAAFPNTTSLNETDLLAAAMWTNHAIGPANRYPKGERPIRIREESNRIHQSVGTADVHEPTVAKRVGCVKYIITQDTTFSPRVTIFHAFSCRPTGSTPSGRWLCLLVQQPITVTAFH